MSGNNNGKVAITGRTYPVRAQLAALGGTWDKVGKCWMVPAEKAEEARAIVQTPARVVAQSSGLAYYVKLLDGWGVCTQTPVEAGQAVDVRTKAGKVNSETLGDCVSRGANGFVYRIRGRVQTVVAPAMVIRDPGEDAADRWADGGGVA